MVATGDDEAAGAFRTLLGDAWVTVLSEPRCCLTAPSAFNPELRLCGGGGLTGLLAPATAILVSAWPFDGQANFIMHFRLGGDCAADSTGAGAHVGDGVFGLDLASSLPRQANMTQRLRPNVASTDCSGPLVDLSFVPAFSAPAINTLRSNGLSWTGMMLYVVGRSGGLIAGLGTLRPSSLVSSAVDAALGLQLQEYHGKAEHILSL